MALLKASRPWMGRYSLFSSESIIIFSACTNDTAHSCHALTGSLKKPVKSGSLRSPYGGGKPFSPR